MVIRVKRTHERWSDKYIHISKLARAAYEGGGGGGGGGGEGGVNGPKRSLSPSLTIISGDEARAESEEEKQMILKAAYGLRSYCKKVGTNH